MGHRWARESVSRRQLGGGRAELAPFSNSFVLNLLSIRLRLDLASNKRNYLFSFIIHYEWP